MSTSLYRVGDYVYYDACPSAPYQIKRIDELIKTPSGQIEAKMTCFYRRRDLPTSLLKIADQAERQEQILWRPRRSLLARHPLASPNGGHGDDVFDGALNGVGGTSASASVSNGSAARLAAKRDTEPTKIKKESIFVDKSVKDMKEKSVDVEKDAQEPKGSTSGLDSETVKMEDSELTIATDAGEDETAKAGDSVKDANELQAEQVQADDAQVDGELELERSFGFAGLPKGASALPAAKVHALRQRELFLSRQTESLGTSHIRGKCAVEILSEVATSDMYLNNEDAFFYSLVYDPANQTLLADKGKIEIGDRHQAVVPEWSNPPAVDATRDAPPRPSNNGGSAHYADAMDDEDFKENGALQMVEDDEDANEEDIADGANGTAMARPGNNTIAKLNAAVPAKSEAFGEVPLTDREQLVYHSHHGLTDQEIDQFLIIARAVGTFSRALDSSATMKLPSLHITAAAASRDVTLLHAMALLHQANYDIGQATKFLVPYAEKYPKVVDELTGHHTTPVGGPILCRDQLEEWSAAEATLFEEAMEKYGKDFHDIRVDCLPWKSIRDIVEYYYMWKTTGRYAEMKKNKNAEKEKQLKQVFVPAYNKPSASLVQPSNTTLEPVTSATPCESCKTDRSLQWYHWGPAQEQMRLCAECWTRWRKMGGLAREHEYDTYDLDGVVESASSQQQQPQQQQQQSLSQQLMASSAASVAPQPAQSQHQTHHQHHHHHHHPSASSHASQHNVGSAATRNANANVKPTSHVQPNQRGSGAGRGGANASMPGGGTAGAAGGGMSAAAAAAALRGVPHNLLQAAARHGGVASSFAQQAAALQQTLQQQQQQQQQAALIAGPGTGGGGGGGPQQLSTGPGTSHPTFYLNTTLQTRIARRVIPKRIFNMRKLARSPFRNVDVRLLLNYYHSRNVNEIIQATRQLRHARERLTPQVIETLTRLHAKYACAPNVGVPVPGFQNASAAAAALAANGNAAALAAALLGRR